jgi:ribosome-associated protein YbcJ (S4-like RNA binding protein)
MTGKKCANKYASGGRVKATVAKAGVTRNGKRRYSCGGKLKTK